LGHGSGCLPRVLVVVVWLTAVASGPDMDDHGFGSLERGRSCSGVVTCVEPFGVFVQLDDGGPEGLISVPELAWRRVRRVEDLARPGDRVGVQVLDVDRQRRRVYLSLRASVADPFPDMIALVGQVVTGEVTKVAPIGVFVRIEDRPDGFEGLLPGLDPDGQPWPDAPYPGEGDRLPVTVVSVDVNRRRILLAPARG
jgi:small subunit ribosomal protein S1